MFYYDVFIFIVNIVLNWVGVDYEVRRGRVGGRVVW